MHIYKYKIQVSHAPTNYVWQLRALTDRPMHRRGATRLQSSRIHQGCDRSVDLRYKTDFDQITGTNACTRPAAALLGGSHTCTRIFSGFSYSYTCRTPARESLSVGQYCANCYRSTDRLTAKNDSYIDVCTYTNTKSKYLMPQLIMSGS